MSCVNSCIDNVIVITFLLQCWLFICGMTVCVVRVVKNLSQFIQINFEFPLNLAPLKTIETYLRSTGIVPKSRLKVINILDSSGVLILNSSEQTKLILQAKSVVFN